MRITDKNLDAIAGRINLLTKSPLTRYSYSNEKKEINRGHYYVNKAHGGSALYQIRNNAGGASEIFKVGHVPKKQLAQLMHAFIEGLLAKK